MSKALQGKIDELFEATKDLMSLEEIKPYCDRFNEWVNQQNLKRGTVGTLFSKYGFYSKFRSIPLEQGKNGDLIAKNNPDGSVKGHELKHYTVLLCGLDAAQWNERNQSTRVISRVENSTEVDPDTYLAVTGKLLNSDDPHELAVGIIAATGRRPHEVLARAKFTPVEGKPYHVMFEGQGKKKGTNPVFEIATLYPAEFVIKCLAKLRREPGIKSLLKEVAAEFPNSITRQNIAIGNRRNKSLLRVVAEYFGDKEDVTPVLNFRHGDEQDNNKALRAAYAALATERDCKGSTGAKLLHTSRLLGHFTNKKEDDRDLVHLATSAGYSDYFVTKPVPFPTLPKKEKSSPVRAGQADAEILKGLQLSWKLPNQQAVIARLIERHEKTVELGKQLQEMDFKLKKSQAQLREAEFKIKQLEKEKTEMSEPKPQSHSEETVQETESLDSKIARILEEKLGSFVKAMPVAQPIENESATESKPVTQVTKQKEVIDWESKTNAELWASKAQGTTEEKIRRCYQAIALYNDTVATGDKDRIAITNQALRELAGVNGNLISDWLNIHTDEVIGHHTKYGMQNAKDPSKVETYYNKRLGKEKISEILTLIKTKFLN